MTKARNIADLLDANGDVKSGSLDNVPAVDLTNLSASNLTSGSIPDARVPASAVSQHATSFDDNKLVNDISTLAIRQASNENKGAYNTNSMYVDVFQDATGYTNGANTTRNASEYISSSSQVADTNLVYLNKMEASNLATDESSNSLALSYRTLVRSSAVAKFGSYSANGGSGTDQYMRTDTSTAFQRGTSDFTIECWFYANNTSGNKGIFGSTVGEIVVYRKGNKIGYYASTNSGASGWNIFNASEGDSSQTFSAGSWNHFALVRSGGTTTGYLNGQQNKQWTTAWALNSNAINIGSDIGTGSGSQSWGLDGYIDEFRFSSNARYSGSSFSVPTAEFSAQTGTFNATGNFTCPTITAPSSVSKMGAIITYQNTSGTNTLNTDIVLKLSADGGSNYSTATLVAMPDFATGIKMAKVNDLSVTAGTSLKYKIEFANQASGSKEARIRGVSLQY